MDNKGTLELVSDKIKLRRYKISDAENMYKNYASDPKVTKFLFWKPYKSVDEVKDFLLDTIKDYDSNQVYHWAIEYQNEIIGSISVTSFNEYNQNCEIGYCIGYEFWNQGIMTKAVKLVINFLFNEVGVHRIMAKHDVENPASGKVMSKCNMVLEGRMKEYYLRHDGTSSDALMYGIINTNC